METPVSFVGEGEDFLGLLFKGAFLEIITLGFYRFWFITNIRRTLWSNTKIDGDALEYTGRGLELLIGFLFALAILAPIYVVYFIIGIEAERWKAFAGVPLFLAFYLFRQFAIYRARRYRLTRTIWRGVRFWMTGSGVSYALRSSAWGLLSLVTLGGAYAWKIAALERYKMRNTHYCDLTGRFEGTGWKLFKAGAWIWAICLVTIIAPWVYASARFAIAAIQHPNDTVALQLAMLELKPWLIVSAASPLIAVLLWPIFLAIEWRWWLEGLRVGGLRFSSQFPRSAILLLYLALFGVMLVVLFAAGILGFVGHFLFRSSEPGWNIGGVIAIALLYLAVLTVFSTFARYFLQFKLWETVMDSLKIRDLAAAANVAARGQAASAFGEGLADGLDVAGF